MQLFEKAIAKELHGLMADAVKYYREAFRLNDRVDLIYRKNTVPQALEKLRGEQGKNASRKVDEAKLKAIDVDSLLASFAHESAYAPDPADPRHWDDGHVAIKFASMQLNGEDRVVDVKPVSPLVNLPAEVWVYVLQILLRKDPEAWFKFGVTCKKHAYLAFHTSGIWRQLCYLIYPKQNYEENVGFMGKSLPVPADPMAVLLHHGSSWKQMIRERPFLKFLGCYISVVNYYSEGGREELSQSMRNPVRTITYYRYLRFYPNGACVMALTRLEPSVVVGQFLKSNSLRCLLTNIDSRDVTKVNPSKEPHKIFHGTWTLSTEGKVHVTVTSGLVPYYEFHYEFVVKNLGGMPNHAKLAWVTFYAVWKTYPGSEERAGEKVEFSLKNEKDFKFLRVRSYQEDN
ncbi:hypothetical protein METBIDRAFT_76972 [Metschnikowia bicuspidata var. bicuspidata NRRL YB-4993]|uniref:F-box protein Hrt3/FBXO9 C-terminal domain-containing protein n=1 Tax=Metschnikowia bicuspidata var. bicuspidata NRRL YB-4993 TaxID=869754 RepID=A0A1A0HJN8_9ASCO|nr:hypothetical protein METBIDRAFT_76972 [Metschnikowia bicuspidata var. bicuspidata NRRL YB-4993]OBA24107.1 hypothetical protein METBIDRAFT_76972 [Metschnikowia bicuspidata var. bicuspidata NRRL YB-4993]